MIRRGLIAFEFNWRSRAKPKRVLSFNLMPGDSIRVRKLLHVEISSINYGGDVQYTDIEHKRELRGSLTSEKEGLT